MAADHTIAKLMIVLLCFWTILIIFTNIFQDYLAGETLTDYNPACIVPKSIAEGNQCVSKYDSGTGFLSNFQEWTNTIINVQAQIPILNLLVPIEKILLIGYNTHVPYWVQTILWLMTIVTILVVYSVIRG